MRELPETIQITKIRKKEMRKTRKKYANIRKDTRGNTQKRARSAALLFAVSMSPGLANTIINSAETEAAFFAKENAKRTTSGKLLFHLGS